MQAGGSQGDDDAVASLAVSLTLVCLARNRSPGIGKHLPKLLQPRHDFGRKQPDSLLSLRVRQEPRAADHHQMTEAADLRIEIVDLTVHRVGIAGEQDAPLPRLIRRQADQRRGVLRSDAHTSELQSLTNLVCRLLLEKKKR